MNKTHAKTVTWVIVSGIVIWIGAYIEIRDIYLSFMASFWAVVLKTPFFWVHEHAWEALAARKNRKRLADATVPLPVENIAGIDFGDHAGHCAITFKSGEVRVFSGDDALRVRRFLSTVWCTDL